MKTEVYSWRVSPEMKTELEHEARRRKTTLSGILDIAARELLGRSNAKDNDQEQQRLQRAAAASFGTISGRADSSETVRQRVRERLRRRYGR